MYLTIMALGATRGNESTKHLDRSLSPTLSQRAREITVSLCDFHSKIPIYTTEIRFLDANDVSAMQVGTKLELEGKRVFSRLINNKLYVVTQHDLSHMVPVVEYPNGYPGFVKEPIIPKIHINDQQTELLYQSSNCYITSQNSEWPVYHALIGVIEIPFDNPTQFKSNCLAGSVEAIYATNETLYLASTRFTYQIFDGFMVYTQPGNETDIHKWGGYIAPPYTKYGS